MPRRLLQDRVTTPGGAVVTGLAIAGVGTLSYLLVRWITGGVAQLPAGVAPPRPSAAPFAELRGQPAWPIVTFDSRIGQVGYTDVNGTVHGNGSRRFGASRDGRKHAGIDLYGKNGDPVVAIADGTVVRTQNFNLGTDAILVEHDGVVALYGEVDRGSWNEFGVAVGSRVKRGQPIARIGCMVGTWNDCDSHMLHFETYAPGTTKNEQWRGSPPAALRDPTYLLLTAAPASANP